MKNLNETSLEKLQSIFFPVEKVSSSNLGSTLQFPRGNEFAIIAPGKDKILNLCSNEYKLISNEALFLPFYQELSNRYGNSEIKTVVQNVDDRKFKVSMVVNNRPYEIQKGDIVNPTIELTNSYDGTAKFSIAVGFHRLICTNGAMAFEHVSKTINKHSSNGNYNFDMMFNMLDNVDAQLNRFKKLSDRRMTGKEVEELTLLIKEKTDFPKRLFDEVQTVIAREQNLLNSEMNAHLLYHGFNFHLNHSTDKMTFEKKTSVDMQVLELIENFN